MLQHWYAPLLHLIKLLSVVHINVLQLLLFPSITHLFIYLIYNRSLLLIFTFIGSLSEWLKRSVRLCEWDGIGSLKEVVKYAVIDGGEAGAAFLGSQGDVWDAQKDILCDTLGAICSSGLYLCRERKSAK